MLTQCVTEAGSKLALGRLDSLHRQTSCNYNNFIFTVKTSGIPREMEHLPVCYAVSHSLVLVTVTYGPSANPEQCTPNSETSGKNWQSR